jgi:hypothetical protein
MAQRLSSTTIDLTTASRDAKPATWPVRADDKALLDALQAWYFLRHGARLAPATLLTLVLAEALTREDGRFTGALEEIRLE